MMRSAAVLAAVSLVAGAAWAKGGGYVVIVPGVPAAQPGDACIAEGVSGGQEAKTSDGRVVLVKGVHGIHTSRCSAAGFPILATTQKLAPEEVRNAPSTQCVPQGVRVGDEVTIDFYGVATVLELRPASSQCRLGLPASVISAAAHRAAKAVQATEAASHAAGPREPTEAEIQKEYDRLLAAFVPVKEFHVRHILVRTREDAEAALREIQSGKSFGEVAAKASLDPRLARKGGDLGWKGASAFTEEFSKTMVGLDPAGLPRAYPHPLRLACDRGSRNQDRQGFLPAPFRREGPPRGPAQGDPGRVRARPRKGSLQEDGRSASACRGVAGRSQGNRRRRDAGREREGRRGSQPVRTGRLSCGRDRGVAQVRVRPPRPAGARDAVVRLLDAERAPRRGPSLSRRPAAAARHSRLVRPKIDSSAENTL